MAQRGSKKFFSIQHEDWIARLFNGRRSKSSGAAIHDAGDVSTPTLLIECKMTTVSKPVPTFVRQLEKIALEAWEKSKEPMLALRYYSPTSVLAGPDGWIDVTVRLASDDATRESNYT